jgi:hypothetical protein
VRAKMVVRGHDGPVRGDGDGSAIFSDVFRRRKGVAALRYGVDWSAMCLDEGVGLVRKELVACGLGVSTC